MLSKSAASLMLLLLGGCDLVNDRPHPPPSVAKPAAAPLKWAMLDHNKLYMTIEKRQEAQGKAEPQDFAKKLAALRAAEQEEANSEQPARQKCADMAGAGKANDSNPAYMQCLRNLKDDPAIKAVRSKLRIMAGALMNRESMDALTASARQNASLSKTVLDSYAAQHDYALIVSNHQPNLLYKQSPTVVDITDDVLKFLAQNPALLDNPPEP
ncbi:MAG: hypothetical protein PHU14_11990 [Methylovulum sp.]|nr:hypothetical protein [Methylovulum sp.]